MPWAFVMKIDAHQHFWRSEEHTSELQSRLHLVCRLLLEKKKDDRLVAFLADDTRDEALTLLIVILDKVHKLPHRAAFRNALLHLDQLLSTGIAMSVV